jgi:hypothetical protein
MMPRNHPLEPAKSLKDDAAALPSEKTSIGDRRLLNLQIPIRKARIEDLLQRRGTLKHRIPAA